MDLVCHGFAYLPALPPSFSSLATLPSCHTQSAVALPEKWLTKGVDELLLLLLLPVLANDFESLVLGEQVATLLAGAAT